MSLIDFTGDEVTVEGEIILPLTAEIDPQWSTVLLTFIVVRVFLAYNVILGRSELNILRAVVSTYYLFV